MTWAQGRQRRGGTGLDRRGRAVVFVGSSATPCRGHLPRLGNSGAAAAEEKRRLESLQLVRGFGTALHRPEVLIRCSLLLGGMWGLGIPSCLVRASSLKLTFARLRQLFSVIGHRSGRERSLRSRVPATGSLPLATEISLLGPSAGTPCRA